MKIPRGWDKAQAYDGSLEKMTAGGHICRIVNARVDDVNGNDMLVLALDVAEGSQYDGFYRRDHKKKTATNPDAKWGCVYRQYVVTREGECNPFFKGIIKCVEESNNGYRWSWQESTLKDKLVGVIFREEEFLKTDGTISTTIRPAFIRSVARIREGVEVPNVKRLTNGATATGAALGQTVGAAGGNGFVQVDDGSLPF